MDFARKKIFRKILDDLRNAYRILLMINGKNVKIRMDEMNSIACRELKIFKNLFVILFLGLNLRVSSENLMLLLLLLLLLWSSMLKRNVDFFGAVEYLVHRETILWESCRTNRCGNAVQTLRLRTHKDLYKT